MKPLNLIVAILLSSCPLAMQAAESQPNLVFLMADDLGWADVAFHGGNAPTPHLDQLRASGLELTQHYVAPLCSPTRAGLLTGRYWSRFGITSPTNQLALPWETITLPRALRAAGYDTCLVGKWHLGSLPEWGPNHFGFSHSYGSLAGGVGPWNHRYKKGPYSITWHRNERLLDEPGHVTDLITREAVRWIGNRGERPFFLYVPFTAVHLPIKEPQEWLDRVPATIEDRGIEDRRVARQYAASVMHLDAAVGRIVSALEQAGKRENTLLVFTSDNGGSTAENNDTRYPDDHYPSGRLTGNNTPLRGGKGQLYEGGIREPTIVRWPGKLPAGRRDQPLHITDWMPTFCALAGCSANPDWKQEELKWDGINLWPILAHNRPRGPHPLYWAGPDFRSRALRAGDWKLITFQDHGSERSELFQLADDPGEKNNLAAKETGKNAELKTKMAAIAGSDRDAVVVD